MNQKSLELLEYKEVLINLADHTVSGLGKKLAADLFPSTDPNSVINMLTETTEAKKILDTIGRPPMDGLFDISESLQKLNVGGILDPRSLTQISDFLRGCRRTKEFMERHRDIAPLISLYAEGLTPLPETEEKIEGCIESGVVSDEAGSKLKKIRRELRKTHEKVKNKINQIMITAAAKGYLQETVISFKNSRYVLPVKATYKSSLPGLVVSSSGSGGTLFIEPLAVHDLSNKIKELEGAEEEEVYRILSDLSSLVRQDYRELETNMEIMAQYDLSFAKARLSREMKGMAPGINARGYINIVNGRHPLLAQNCVPLNFHIGDDFRSLVITGPNTGGKTVTLKTVGLLTLMVQSGLHIPAEEGTEMSVFSKILSDIGDGQNIAQSLSTFSAHISNIIKIIKECGNEERSQNNHLTLVLLDEVGTGTDPTEGSALAIAILEELYSSGAITVASTHYPEIKEYAMTTSGFINGSMTFDRKTLKPMYQLIIGQPGESNAIWIAENLGMPRSVLDKANREIKRNGHEQRFPSFSPGLREMKKVEKKHDESNHPTRLTFINKEENKNNLCVSDDTEKNTQTEKEEPNHMETSDTPRINIGDMVSIPYLGEKGVVSTPPDAKGRIKVLIKGKKMEVSIRRVNLLISSEKLYPKNYDLDIILLSKEDRKTKKRLGKRHQPGLTRIIEEE